MSYRVLRMLVAPSLIVLALAACGGGGGGGSAPGPGPSPTPQPTANANTYQVRFIIEEDGSTGLEVVPSGGQPVAPSGGQVGQPDAGAIVTYPDGSTQIADASGDFVPAQSTYAQANAHQLETSPEAQPYVVVSDAQGKAAPTALYVSAYNGATLATASFARRPQGGLRLASSSQPTVSLGGVRTLPAGFALFTNETTTLHVQGVDIDGHLTALTSAQISWNAAQGIVTPIAGTAEAIYAPPQISGSSSTLDTITATVGFAGSSLQFTATSTAQVFPPGAGVLLSGTVSNASGSALANSAALFVQANVPRVFHPYYWLALAGGAGSYSRYVPANQLLTSILGITAASSGGAFGYVVADSSAAPNQAQPSMFTSGNMGTSQTDGLMLPASPVAYIDTAGLAKNSIPPLIPFLRDAHSATSNALTRHVYDADSGIQALLASPPASSSLPSPSTPALLSSGMFYHWCYQWEMLAGAETLVLEENSGSTCAQGGNDAFTVTPGSTTGAYSFVHYYLSSGTYAVSGPTLDPTNGGSALLAHTGSWMQTLQESSGTITSDSATVQGQYYNQSHQTLGTPAYDEQLAYQYTLGSGSPALATVTISNDTFSNAANGHVLQQSNRTETQVNPLHGTGGCVSSGGVSVQGVPCYTVTGTLTRTYYVSSGTFTKTFAINETLNGDGSASLKYASQNPGDASYVSVPVASYTQRSAGSCLVCSSNPGAVFDVDGTTQLASFTINRALLTQVNLLSNGSAVGAFAFTL